MKILLLDDTEHARKTLANAVRKRMTGLPDFKLFPCGTVSRFETLLRNNHFDAVVSDCVGDDVKIVNMRANLGLVRKLQPEGNLPALIMRTNSPDTEKLISMDEADAYLEKTAQADLGAHFQLIAMNAMIKKLRWLKRSLVSETQWRLFNSFVPTLDALNELSKENIARSVGQCIYLSAINQVEGDIVDEVEDMAATADRTNISRPFAPSQFAQLSREARLDQMVNWSGLSLVELKTQSGPEWDDKADSLYSLLYRLLQWSDFNPVALPEFVNAENGNRDQYPVPWKPNSFTDWFNQSSKIAIEDAAAELAY